MDQFKILAVTLLYSTCSLQSKSTSKTKIKNLVIFSYLIEMTHVFNSSASGQCRPLSYSLYEAMSSKTIATQFVAD